MEKKAVMQANLAGAWRQRGNAMVAPAVLVRETVLCGSRGCLLHPRQTIQQSVKSWNGIPVTLSHPTDSRGQPVSIRQTPGKAIGHVEAPRFRNGKLLADIVIPSPTPALRTKLAPLKQVSVGLYSDEIPATGVYGGKEYSAISQDYRPDHLAILPQNEQAACAWGADGCGIGANADALQSLVAKALWGLRYANAQNITVAAGKLLPGGMGKPTTQSQGSSDQGKLMPVVAPYAQRTNGRKEA